MASFHNGRESRPTDEYRQAQGIPPDCPARSTIYDRICQNRIPVHEDEKKLRFLRSEIDQWLSDGRIKTKDEIEKVLGKRLFRRHLPDGNQLK